MGNRESRSLTILGVLVAGLVLVGPADCQTPGGPGDPTPGYRKVARIGSGTWEPGAPPTEPLLLVRELATGARIWNAAFSPDGRSVAVALDDGTLKVFDPGSGSLRAERRAERSRLLTVQYSPDGALLAVGGAGKIRIYDSASLEPSLTLAAGGEVWGLAFAPDGRRLAVRADRDGGIRIFDLALARQVAARTLVERARNVSNADPSLTKLELGGDNHTDLVWSGDGAYLFTSNGFRDPVPQVQRWDVATGRLEKAFAGHTQGIRSLAAFPGAHLVLSGSYDRSWRLFDTRSSQGAVLAECDEDVNGVAASGDSMWAAAGIDDGELLLFDMRARRLVQRSKPHRGWISCVAFSPDSRLLVSGGQEPTLRIWKVPAARPAGWLDDY